MVSIVHDRRARPSLIRGGTGDPPFVPDAVVLEEDTSLVLSADPTPRDPGEHPIRIMTALYDHRPCAPGSVVVQGRFPVRMLAMVHDLDQDPTWREEWVCAALDEVLAESGRRGLRRLAMEPLGTVHGRLARERFMALLEQALARASPASPQEIWLMER